MKFGKVSTVLLCLMLLTGLFIMGCQPGEEEAVERDYFKIGVITELTGELTYGGHVTKRGQDAWAAKINEIGGIEINGEKYKVELIYADAQSDPSIGADAAERLITEEKVDFLFGPYSSSVTLGVAPIADKYQIPLISGSAESPLIWQQHFEYTFGIIPPVTLFMINGGVNTLLTELEPAPTSIFIVGTDDAFSKAGAEMTRDFAEERGVEVVGFEIVPKGIDYMPIVMKAKTANPDIYLVSAHIIDHLENAKAAKEADFNPKAFLFHYGLTATDFYSELGADAENMFGSAVWAPELDFPCPLFGSTAGYVEHFQKLYNSTPDYTECSTAAIGIVCTAALQQMGATPPLTAEQKVQLKEVLEEIEITTCYGRTKFETEGEYFHCNTGVISLAMQVQNGKPVVVGPADLKLADPVYPRPPWR